jgi:hypothetical protein
MFVPSPRHGKGPTGLRDLSIASLGLVAAVIELAQERWWQGLLALVVSAVIGREALMKSKAGNWPSWLRS